MNIKVLISEREIQNRIKEIAKQIEKDYENKRNLIGEFFLKTEKSVTVDSQIMMRFPKNKPAIFNGLLQFVKAIHFAVSVGNASKIKRCRL